MEQSLTFKQVRRNLNNRVSSIAGPDVKLYFQPPTNVSLQFPSIVYRSTGTMDTYGNGKLYLRYYEFELVVITKDAESQLPYDLVDGLEYATITSQYQSDNLYHTAIRVSTIN